MDRRTLLASLGAAGVAGTAGCGALGGNRTLSDPTVDRDSPSRAALLFSDGDTEVGTLGVGGSVGTDAIRLDTNIWHRDDTRVESIRLHVWTEPDDEPADVALVSPVTGDSSPPPSVSLGLPDRGYGTVIEIDDLDDLADETISTIDLLVAPRSESFEGTVIDAEIELSGTAWNGDDYTLRGRLDLSFPEFGAE